MTYKPIDTLADDITAGSACAVCGQQALHVLHIASFPDYIECRHCRSAFIFAEDEEHVLYGKISGNFPETREMALKQWILLDVVQRIAQKERISEADRPAAAPAAAQQASAPQAQTAQTAAPPAAAPQDAAPQAAPEPKQPAVQTAEEADKPESAPAAPASSMKQAAPVQRERKAPAQQPDQVDAEPPETPGSFSALWKAEPIPTPDLLRDAGQQSRQPAAAPPAEKPGQPGLERSPVFLSPGSRGETPPPPMKMAGMEGEAEKAALEGKGVPKVQAREPDAGIRFRVVLSGSQIKFPYKVCSHCLTSPASSSLSLTAFLPDAADAAQRVPTPIRIPLCTSCRKRASAQGEEEKQARSRAFLYSAGISLLLIFMLLLTGILGKLNSVFLGSFLILITATIGYGIPLVILLERSSHFAPPADAFYVLSTLFLPPSPQQDMTVFDWRNPGYAELFHLANRSVTVKSVHEVDDQGPVLPKGERTPESSAPPAAGGTGGGQSDTLLKEELEKTAETDNPDTSVV